MFGLGKIPKIPGTFGSLATVINTLPVLFHILNMYLLHNYIDMFDNYFYLFFFSGRRSYQR